MTSGKILMLVSSVIVLGAIGVGISLTGGPEQARQDERDDDRLIILRKMNSILNCHYDETGSFPKTLTKDIVDDKCDRRIPDDGIFNDPLTDEALRFEFIAENHAQTCATFETDEKRLIRLSGNDEKLNHTTGCFDITRD